PSVLVSNFRPVHHCKLACKARALLYAFHGSPSRRDHPNKQKITSMRPPPLAYNGAMNGITIYVDWAYFLGIVGTLIGIAYYANGRFTKIETTVEWLKEILLEIKVRPSGRRQGQGKASRYSGCFAGTSFA